MGLGEGTTTITATLNAIQGSATISVTPPILNSIVVTPANTAIAVGTTLQMTATGVFSDNSMQDLTQQAEFSTSDPTVVVADDILLTNGLMNAVAPGMATIFANYGGIVGSTSVTVNAVALTSITITPSGPIFIATKKGSVQLTATCNFNNTTTQDCTNQVNWDTAANNIARLDHRKHRDGLVVANNPGQTSVTAELNGVTSSVTVIVTNASVTGIQVTPTNPTVPVGTTLPMTATVFFSDKTSQDFTMLASWISSDTNVAHVLSSEDQGNGQVIALQPGTSTISVTICCYLNASTTVTVIP